MAVNDNPVRSIDDGRQVVATAGTRVQLSTATTPIAWVTVTALSTNTGVVTVGGPNVVGAAGTRRGVGLSAGASWTIPTDQLADVWLDAMVNGEGVSYAFGLT